MATKECDAIKALSPREDGLSTIFYFTKFVMSVLPVTEPVKSAIENLISIIGELVSGRISIRDDEKGIKHKIVSWIMGINKDNFISSLAQFISRVNEAWQYLNKSECAEAVNEVANEWSMNAEQFKNLIINIHELTKGRVVTEEELRKVGKVLDEQWSEVEKLRG